MTKPCRFLVVTIVIASSLASVSSAQGDYGETLQIGGDREILLGGLTSANRTLWQSKIPTTGMAGALSLGIPDSRQTQSLAYSQAIAAGDIDGDGFDEMLQATSHGSATGTVRIYATDYSAPGNPAETWDSGTSILSPTLAAGDIDRQVHVSAQRRFRDELILAGITPGTRQPVVRVIRANGSGALPTSGQAGIWTGAVQNIDRVLVACGDTDLDGSENVVLAAFGNNRLYVNVFQWDTAATVVNQKLRPTHSREWEISSFNYAALVLGDIDGDFRKEIVVARTNRLPDYDNGIGQILVDTLEPDPNNTSVLKQFRNFPITTGDGSGSIAGDALGIKCGDTNRDGIDELVLAHYFQNDFNIATMRFNPDASTAEPLYFQLNTWQFPGLGYGGDGRNLFDLAVGDIDGDAYADIVTVLKNRSNEIEVRSFREIAQTGGALYGPVVAVPGAPSGLSDRLTLVLADADNDSLYGLYADPDNGSRLTNVTETQVSFVGYVPPYWKSLQDHRWKAIGFGKSHVSGTSTGGTLTMTSEDTVTYYAGAGIDSEVFEANLKASASYASTSAITRNNWEGTSTETGVGYSISGTNIADALVSYGEATYDCYNYQMMRNGLPVDGAFRISRRTGRTRREPNIDEWYFAALAPGGEATRGSWIPLTREWADLCLFRGSFATQSSTASESYVALIPQFPFFETRTRPLPASLAVNADRSDASRTNLESQPWWQIDLGQACEIHDIRLWKGRASQINWLRNGVVAISLSPFRDDTRVADLLADPSVRVIDIPENAGTVANVLAAYLPASAQAGKLIPAVGRYVRVQLRGTESLSLANVQVFGPPHRDPDSYPSDIRTASDGSLEVQLYDRLSRQFRWRTTRGKLLWDGQGKVLEDLSVELGETIDWHRTDTSTVGENYENTLGHSTSVGVEVSVSAGLVGKVSAGAAVEGSFGVQSGNTLTQEWQDSLTLSGEIQGFDRTIISSPENAAYQFVPYLYEITDYSSAGYRQRYMVLDYYVPEGPTPRKRADWADNENSDDENKIFVAARFTPYAAWRAFHFDPTAGQAFSLPFADANGDGLSNIVAYSQNCSPWLRLGSHRFAPVAPQFEIAGGSMVLRTRRRDDDPGLRVRAQISDELSFFGAAEVPPATFQGAPGLQNVEFTIPPEWRARHSRGFMRLVYDMAD